MIELGGSFWCSFSRMWRWHLLSSITSFMKHILTTSYTRVPKCRDLKKKHYISYFDELDADTAVVSREIGIK